MKEKKGFDFIWKTLADNEGKGNIPVCAYKKIQCKRRAAFKAAQQFLRQHSYDWYAVRHTGLQCWGYHDIQKSTIVKKRKNNSSLRQSAVLFPFLLQQITTLERIWKMLFVIWLRSVSLCRTNLHLMRYLSAAVISFIYPIMCTGTEPVRRGLYRCMQTKKEIVKNIPAGWWGMKKYKFTS